MKIEQAKPIELIDVYYLFKECAKDMNLDGIFHWNQYYPGMNLIDQQIQNKNLYIVKYNGICIGCMVLNEKSIAEYNDISWTDKSAKSLNIQWLAIHPLWKGKGIDKELIEFADNYAKESGFGVTRLDVYASNESGLSMCNSQGYNERGEIFYPHQRTPFKCFEKIL